MKAPDIDSLKSAWKKEEGFDSYKLSEIEIEKYLQKKSRDIWQQYKKGLIFDVVLKGILGISLLVIAFLLKENTSLLISMGVLVIFLLWTIRFQLSTYRNIPSAQKSEPSMRASLENGIEFYHRHYVKSIYVGALSNSLIFLSGSLYYFYFKYGEIRPMDLTDYLVFGGAILIAFVLSAVINMATMNFQVKQLVSCLKDIDEESISALTLREQRNKRWGLFFIVLLALICGLGLLAYFIS